jgi:hypothetical protein
MSTLVLGALLIVRILLPLGLLLIVGAMVERQRLAI